MHFIYVMSGSSFEGEAVLLKPCERLDKHRGQNVMCTCCFVLQSDPGARKRHLFPRMLPVRATEKLSLVPRLSLYAN